MPICPVCGTKYIADKTKLDKCTKCIWDLKIYSLTPNGLKQERKTRVEWAKRIWRELQALNTAIDDLRDEYQYLLEKEQESVDELQEFLESEQVKFKQIIKELEINFKNEIQELKKEIEYLSSEPNRIELKRYRLLNEYDYRNFNSYPNDRKITTTLPMKVVEAIKNKTGYRGIDEWLRNYAIDAAIKEGWLDE
jgi:DNA repair exonuclease SbcCD ATPase subunit